MSYTRCSICGCDFCDCLDEPAPEKGEGRMSERVFEAARETIQRFETDDTLAAESFDEPNEVVFARALTASQEKARELREALSELTAYIDCDQLDPDVQDRVSAALDATPRAEGAE